MTHSVAEPADEITDPELVRLRAGLAAIMDKSRRAHNSWYPGREFPTEMAREWHNGFITALSTCSLLAQEALDPEAKAKADDDWLAASGTDRDWFERTGNCGHCGNHAPDCVCTDDDPCACGPHEPRTWPIQCWRCDGTGVVNPVAGRAVHPNQGVLLVPASPVSESGAGE